MAEKSTSIQLSQNFRGSIKYINHIIVHFVYDVQTLYTRSTTTIFVLGRSTTPNFEDNDLIKIIFSDL